jgi:site-specific recombinase XerD
MGWESFLSFCTENDLNPLPAGPQTVVAYMEHLAVNGYSYNSIDTWLSAIAAVHTERQEDNPCQSQPVRRQRKNLRRTMDLTTDQKQPLLLAHIKEILEMMEATDLTAIRDRAVLLLGFAGAFRRSELVGLDVGDVRDVKGGKVLLIRHSKTDQEGQGKIKQIPDEVAFPSPNEALDRWLQAADIRSGPVFRMVDRWGNVRDKRLSGRSVAKIVKKYAQQIGEDPAEFGAHSLRAGFLTQGYVDGVGDHELADQSDHSSFDVLRSYQRISVVMDNHPLTRMGRH